MIDAGSRRITPEYVMTSQAETKAFDLAALLAPARPEDFFREYWERKPLHQARLVEAALPPNVDTFSLVGHSFGGSVAMKLAARLSNRVAKLVLLETNPFYLLKQAGRADAFAEARDLRDCIKKFGALGEWVTAAERFADYWGALGPGRACPQNGAKHLRRR